MRLREGVIQLAVFEEEHRVLVSLLRRVRTDTRARSVLLIDANGQLVAAAGDTAGLDVTSFASLAASNLAATASMARLVGEDDFTILFHQGARDSIHLSLVAERVLLAVIFGGEASLGMVRLRARRASAELQGVVDRIYRRTNLEQRLHLDPLCEITDEDVDGLFSFER